MSFGDIKTGTDICVSIDGARIGRVFLKAHEWHPTPALLTKASAPSHATLSPSFQTRRTRLPSATPSTAQSHHPRDGASQSVRRCLEERSVGLDQILAPKVWLSSEIIWRAAGFTRAVGAKTDLRKKM